MATKVLSMLQPWCSAVFHLGKGIENRSWSTKYRGDLLLHASAEVGTRQEFHTAVCWIRDLVEARDRVQWSDYWEEHLNLDAHGCWRPGEGLELGGIVGQVQLIDVIAPGDLAKLARYAAKGFDPRWYMPEWHGKPQYVWVFAEPEPLPFYACRGWQGLWNCPPAIEVR